MPTFISDPPQALYIVLALALVVTGGLAAQRQDKRAAVPFGVAFLLMVAVFVLDRVFESPREEAVRRSFQMAVAADAKNPDAFAEHLADTFEFAYGNEQPKPINREEFKKSPFWALLKQHNPKIYAENFSRDDVKQIDDNTVEIGFMAKGEAGGTPYRAYVRATYRKQPDGTMKLVLVRLFDPIDHSKPPPVTIPNFP